MSVPVIGPAGYKGSHLTRALMNWIEFIKKKGNAICSVAVIFVILTIVLRSIQEAYFTLPSFDGAINLQVPETLIRYGRYATSYNSIIDFDHSIQSGFPLLLPIYFMFLIFGKSTFTAQLVSSTYLILAAVVIYHLTAINTNRVFALICMVLFMLTPSLLEYGHHIYGEIPALFYLLSSLVILYRLEKNPDGTGIFLPFLAGFLYGLSYLTKTVMLIAAPSIILFCMIDLLFIHKLKMKHYILMLIGFILPIVAFECYKLIQLGADAYSEWWKKQSSSIMTHVGVMEKYEDTANLYVKMLVHTKKFCRFFRMNIAVMLCFLCIPHLIFTVNFLYHFIIKRRDQVKLALAIVYGTACTYMVWWICMTPTARAWPRRIIDGYILQEIAFVISLYFLWKFLSTTNYKVQFSKKIIGGVVFTVLLLVILYQGVVNIKHVGFLFKPSQEKLDAERIAKTIELLPEKAKIFGFGWWQAPILSFLSNRMFLDIALHRLPNYPVKLRDTYFVIDYPEALETVEFYVLEKTKNRLIEKQGYNYLYQIEYNVKKAKF
jgi:hypothetical protein